jgi:phosphoglycolate phosphatase
MADKKIKIKFKGVIFDLDGTLANTLEDIADSLNRVLVKNGFPEHDYNTYKKIVGKGIENLVCNSIPERFREKVIIAGCVESMINDYKDNCLIKTELYPGIAEMLDKLKGFDFKAAVFSNKVEKLSQKIVNALIDNFNFNIVLGAKPELPKKPDPAGALMICKTFGFSPPEIIYVGDSGTDMITANKAGMFAIGVTWGFRTKDELLDNGAQMLLNEPGDLIKFLARK